MKPFNHEKYIEKQSEEILNRLGDKDTRVYLEFGGKLVDDYHASRVLPGFKPSAKVELIAHLRDQAEIIICINAKDIEKHKIRADFGITYDVEVFRLIDMLRGKGISVNSVVITQFSGQPAALAFQTKLDRRGIKTYIHTLTKGYPTNVDVIVSEEGYGANPYIETTKPLVIVTAPGPGGGKLGTCLSQMYHEHQRGVKVDYVKYETFPIWNLPLNHPVNVAYEAATVDLKDVNMLDSFHIEAYGAMAVNYNRDLAVFPVLKNILTRITGECKYKSPTDMGVNMTGFCIDDDDAVKEASKQEILRRYYKCACDYKAGHSSEEEVALLGNLLSQLSITPQDRSVAKACLAKVSEVSVPVVAIELEDGTVITGKDTGLLTAGASAMLNAIKHLAHIGDELHLLAPNIIVQVLDAKGKYMREAQGGSQLNVYDVVLCLGLSKVLSPVVGVAMTKLDALAGCEAHSSFIMDKGIDATMYRKLGIKLTCEPEFNTDTLYNE